MYKEKYIQKIFLLISFFFGLSIADEVTDTMKNYCVVPPFMETIKPNIILVQDFSGSMLSRAYETSYDKNKTYYGYFEPNKYYSYNSNDKYWEVNENCNIDENSKYYRIGNSEDCISGNLLNWLATSRIDIALKVLTGGKEVDCGNNTCIANRSNSIEGTIYIDTNEQCIINLEAQKIGFFGICTSNSSYEEDAYNKCDMTISISPAKRKTCPLGNFSDRLLRVKVSSKTGILQKNQNFGNYALIVFGGKDDRLGEIRVGLDEYESEGMDYFISKLENEFPNSYTPTGPALWEVYDYLKQSNEHNYEDNSNYINKGTSKDPYYDDNLEKFIPCKQNIIILISDGEWNVDPDPAPAAYTLHTSDLRPDLDGNQNALVFSLFVFSTSDSGQNAMKTVAAAGTFQDLDGDSQPFDINVNEDSRDVSYPRPNCNPSGNYDENKCKEWDADRDGVPNGYFYASNGEDLENAIKTIFTAIKKHSYSGGAVAVLGERDKESSATGVFLDGSVLTQSLFFTQKYGVAWVGKVYGYWYDLLDETIREDTDTNKILNPTIDKIIKFALENKDSESSTNGDECGNSGEGDKLVICRYNVNATTGEEIDLDAKLYDPDEINYLFETGYNLWIDFDESNEDDEDDRRIYFAACEKGEDCLKEFKYTTLSDFMLTKSYESNIFRIPLLGFPAECFNMCNYLDGMTSFDFIGIWNQFLDCLNNNNDYDKLIKYIRGQDFEGWRNRTVDGKVWKLGDIIHSSPKIVHYRDKNVIIVGANDGMLHVFELGQSVKASTGNINDLVELKGENIGKELWAFIPLNMLPYLRFLTDPNYCHTYYVDSSVYIFDTKDGRKILIGAMRLGGGTGDTTTSDIPEYKPVNPPKWACPTTLWDFMKEQCNSCASYFPGFGFACTLIPSSPPDYSHCIGLSSYFAIDITDIDNPKFLWEFSHPELGFTYSGPAIIEKGSDTYVMFGSGPTNYYGNSNQNLKFFTIKLDGSNLENPYIMDTGIANAFSGRLFTKGFDLNNDSDTDYIFVGYGRRDGDMNNWKGGVLMLDVRNSDPSNWTFQKYFEDAITPITSRIEIGKCFDKYYIYFGTGRWFYKSDNVLSGQKERLYGVPLNCDTQTLSCSLNTNVAANPQDVCTDASNNVIRGWYVELDLEDSNYYKERNITDPLLTNQNVILFTTIEPTKDPCKFGGRTRVWALNCATGGPITDNCLYYRIDIRTLRGSSLLQLSGGDIKQINLRSIAEYQQNNNTRTTEWYTGTSPESSPSFVVPIAPKSGELLLWLER